MEEKSPEPEIKKPNLVKKIIAPIALVLLAIVGLIVFSNVGLGGSTSGTTHKMVFDGDAYKPADITINKGDTIEFVNNSDKPFWPASNIHPTHGIYPEFDPEDVVQAGESWSFKFDKTGEWSYHDHLYPYITGKITVK